MDQNTLIIPAAFPDGRGATISMLLVSDMSPIQSIFYEIARPPAFLLLVYHCSVCVWRFCLRVGVSATPSLPFLRPSGVPRLQQLQAWRSTGL